MTRRAGHEGQIGMVRILRGAPKVRKHQFSDEELAFVAEKHAAGLTHGEVARMFFRKFGVDLDRSHVTQLVRRFHEAKSDSTVTK